MKVIMIRPAYDDETRTMNKWGASVMASVPKSDDLTGSLATEVNLRRSLQKNPPAELIAFYGHGEADHLVGHLSGASSTSAVVHASGPGVLPTELSGRNLYAVACHAGTRLGPALKAAGCRFVGYSSDFVYAGGFEDDFEKVVNNGLIAWATRGKTSTRIKRQLKEDWDRLRKDASRGARSNFLVALAANWNRDYVCSH